LILLAQFARAQVKFSAGISPAQIGKDEYAQLKLTVENAKEVQQIQPPQLKDFVIISGPNQESGMSMINGTVKRYIALSYIIRPKKPGHFSIPPVLARIDGAEYKSNPVDIIVTATASGNSGGSNVFNNPFGNIDPFAEPAPQSSYRDNILRKGENPLDKINKNMFVKLEVDKTSCYVGEPVVATYKLFTRLKSESNMTRNPSFNGFSVIDLQQPDHLQYHIEKVGGKEYNVYIIRKVQLYPLLPGNLEPGTVEIENNVHFIKAEYAEQRPDIFSELFRDFADATIPADGIVDQKVSLRNKPLTISVKSLPDANKPASFKGAVGNFGVVTRVQQDDLSTDDAGKLAVIISGEGNLQLINAPEIKWPEGLEGFDPKTTDDLYKTTVPVSGRKIFEFPFTAVKPGVYEIPGPEFSFFDPRNLTYKTVTTNPVRIKITRGTGRPKSITTAKDTPAKNPYLARFFGNRLRVVSLVAVLVICGLIIWLKKEKRKDKQAEKTTVVQPGNFIIENPAEEIGSGELIPLEAARSSFQKGDTRAFYLEMNQAFKKYLAGKFSIPPEMFNRKNISEHLDKKGVSLQTSIQLQQLMDEIEWQLYTPYAETEKMKDIYERANEIIQLLNTYHS